MGITPDKNGLAWIRDLTGGLNDTDAPQDIGQTQCQIAQNVEWITTRFGQRRQGGSNPIGTEVWTTNGSLVVLMRHTPSANEEQAELFGIDNGSPVIMGRLAASTNWAAVTVNDSWTLASVKYINGVSLSGRLYVAGDTSQDRLHVWDGTSLRRVGVATSAAPTVADTGAGTYPATLRYYKVQWLRTVGGVTQQSELTPAVSFTPSGGGTHARVTQPTVPSNEGITNWQVFGSPDGVNYYLIAFIAVGTTTFDDNTAPSAYSTVFPTAAGYPTDADYFTTPISAKYVLADEDRLLLFSSWETASMASAVMWTPVIGTTPAVYGVTDEERIPSTNRLDLDRSDGGGITGAGMLEGVIYAFKLSQIHRLNRTGNVEFPYQPKAITKSLGCVSHKSIVVGEDDAGAPCLYFMSLRGPYRITVEGVIEYLGRDIETFIKAMNFESSLIPVFGVWHQEKRQVQWWLSTRAGNVFPDRKLVIHARHAHRNAAGEVRGGIAVHTDGAADCLAAVMFANTPGATMSIDLKPWCAQVWQSGLPDGPIVKYDADGTYTDRGTLATTYIGRLKTLAFPPGGDGMKGGITQTYLLGTAANRVMAVDAVRDFGAETRSTTITLPAAGSPAISRALVKDSGDALLADAMYAELVVDDDVSPASSAAWTVDALGIRVRTEGQI